MDGSYLRFYVHEDDRHHHQLVWEWLLTQANKLGIRGGSAFKSMAGFGRHHVLHKGTFFELAGAQAIDVEFLVTHEEADKLFQMLQKRRCACSTHASRPTSASSIQTSRIRHRWQRLQPSDSRAITAGGTKARPSGSSP